MLAVPLLLNLFALMLKFLLSRLLCRPSVGLVFQSSVIYNTVCSYIQIPLSEPSRSGWQGG